MLSPSRRSNHPRRLLCSFRWIGCIHWLYRWDCLFVSESPQQFFLKNTLRKYFDSKHFFGSHPAECRIFCPIRSFKIIRSSLWIKRGMIVRDKSFLWFAGEKQLYAILDNHVNLCTCRPDQPNVTTANVLHIFNKNNEILCQRQFFRTCIITGAILRNRSWNRAVPEGPISIRPQNSPSTVEWRPRCILHFGIRTIFGGRLFRLYIRNYSGKASDGK